MKDSAGKSARSSQRTIFFKTILILFIGLFTSAEQVSASEQTDSLPLPPNDSIRISLLTCSPGEDAAYELFGHTAIRIQNPSRNLDGVFNYGMFTFNTPFFIYRFTKGETDYFLDCQDTQHFLIQYALRNSSVTEQELNISQKEAWKLFDALVRNAQPENRMYRYNFLFDNCSNRAGEMIVKQLDEKVTYADSKNKITFREVLNRYTDGHYWLTFGINLVLGSTLDRPMTYAESMFLPDNLMQAFEKAQVQGDSLRPLVKSTRFLVEKDPKESPEKKEPPFLLFLPLGVTLLLLIIVCAITVYECGKGKTIRWFDSLLFGLYGLTGCIVFFLMFVSEHPATYPNYNGFWLHPFHLFIAIAIWIDILKTPAYWYHWANLVVLVGLILSWAFIPQELALTFLILALTLAIRSVSYITVHHSDQKFGLPWKKAKKE